MTPRIEALNAEARRALKEGRAAESLALYGNALRTEPSFEGYQNSALALSHLGHLQEALALSSRLIEGFPDQPLAWFNHAFFLANLDRAEDALPAADRALALAPQFDKAQKLKAECLLALGRYREGFALHARCYEKVVSRHANLIPRPLWLGAEALRGKRILLHLEPHYGNTIQLLRYAQLAVDAGATVIVEVQPTLKPLLVGSPHIASVNAIGEKLPDFDLHCPFAALPYLFGTTVESVPRGIPYLEPPSTYREKWASIIDRGALVQGIARRQRCLGPPPHGRLVFAIAAIPSTCAVITTSGRYRCQSCSAWPPARLTAGSVCSSMPRKPSAPGCGACPISPTLAAGSRIGPIPRRLSHSLISSFQSTPRLLIWPVLSGNRFGC